jgi:hypothetical protein
MLDLKESRELYKAFRSAQDGVCPECGGKVARVCMGSPYLCLEEDCDFYLTSDEVDDIKSMRWLFRPNLTSILNTWRESRG